MSKLFVNLNQKDALEEISGGIAVASGYIGIRPSINPGTVQWTIGSLVGAFASYDDEYEMYKDQLFEFCKLNNIEPDDNTLLTSTQIFVEVKASSTAEGLQSSEVVPFSEESVNAYILNHGRMYGIDTRPMNPYLCDFIPSSLIKGVDDGEYISIKYPVKFTAITDIVAGGIEYPVHELGPSYQSSRAATLSIRLKANQTLANRYEADRQRGKGILERIMLDYGSFSEAFIKNNPNVDI